jgi:two-component system sensor histidine kinase/response regulator
MNDIHPPHATAEILLVGDRPENLRLLSVILSENGYKVRKATTGKGAIASSGDLIPDLILLDLALPDLDSYEVCRRLKEIPELLPIPVIFISDPPEALDRDRAFAVGGADSIAPPFHVQEVLARICDRLALRWQQQQLYRQNLRLQAEIQDRQKAEDTLHAYVRTIASELRHPIAAMAATFKQWLRDGYPADFEVTIAQLRQRCDRQLDRIDALMEVNDLEVWGTVLDCQPLNLYDLVQALVEEWQPLLLEFPAQLDNRMAIDLPTVRADPHQLWRVFNNLIDNALRHNSPPIHIILEAWQGRDRRIICTVSDNGQGINPEIEELLFESHQQPTLGHSTKLGFGLYLCRQIIQANGGEIQILANPEGGTTVRFTLPLATH